MAPAPAFCEKKKALLDQFTSEVSNYLRMQSAQLAAALRGDGFQFEVELTAARKKKDSAKRAVEEHQREHGC